MTDEMVLVWFTEEGTAQGLLFNGADVQHLSAAEALLRARAEQYQRAFEASDPKLAELPVGQGLELPHDIVIKPEDVAMIVGFDGGWPVLSTSIAKQPKSTELWAAADWCRYMRGRLMRQVEAAEKPAPPPGGTPNIHVVKR